MVRVKGIEPPLPEGNQILSLARLPVPPPRLYVYANQTVEAMRPRHLG